MLARWRRRAESAARSDDAADVRLEATVRGDVQGVGFRFRTRIEAQRLGLRGAAVNEPDGTVRVVAEGARDACEALLAWLPNGPGRVEGVSATWTSPQGMRGFGVG